MPTGKFAAQAAHASAQTLIAYLLRHPGHARYFHDLGLSGARIILTAPDEAALLRAHEQARAAGLPCSLFYDSGHVLSPHFDGSRILTALGIGPALRGHIRPITRRCTLA